ncbi:unnamed protein product [Victoria cruziana]
MGLHPLNANPNQKSVIGLVFLTSSIVRFWLRSSQNPAETEVPTKKSRGAGPRPLREPLFSLMKKNTGVSDICRHKREFSVAKDTHGNTQGFQKQKQRRHAEIGKTHMGTHKDF